MPIGIATVEQQAQQNLEERIQSRRIKEAEYLLQQRKDIVKELDRITKCLNDLDVGAEPISIINETATGWGIQQRG